jgi:hypothetical protein
MATIPSLEDCFFASATALARAVRDRKLSVAEVVEAHLQRIEIGATTAPIAVDLEDTMRVDLPYRPPRGISVEVIAW